MRCTRSRGFTIVELLVVIAIIGLLVGILLPVLGGVRRRGDKLTEMNSLRQVGLAWTLYGNNNNGAALPGYLEPEIMDNWRVKYDFVDRSDVPDALARSWSWRLMTYLDFDVQGMLAHLDLDPSGAAITATNIGTDTDLAARALAIAEEPAFAYNAIYVGGWWEEFQAEDSILRMPRYSVVDGKPTRLVARAISNIKRSTEVIVFTTATKYAIEGATSGGSVIHKKVDRGIAGSHYAVPSNLAGELIWESGGTAGMHAVLVHEDREPTPIGRYTGQVPMLFADVSTNAELPAALMDQRRWIDAADTKDFTHSP